MTKLLYFLEHAEARGELTDNGKEGLHALQAMYFPKTSEYGVAMLHSRNSR